MAVLGEVDALVFAGGGGENSADIREACCDGLEGLGFRIDHAPNRAVDADVSEIQHRDDSRRILVVRSNEELQIARDAVDVLGFRNA